MCIVMEKSDLFLQILEGCNERISLYSRRESF